MPGKRTFVNSLETRKQLLVAESELNRAELLREIGGLKKEVVRVKKQVQAAGSIASTVALAATAFSIFRRRSTKPTASATNGRAKMPWIFSLIEGARVGASLFSKVRSFMRDRE